MCVLDSPNGGGKEELQLLAETMRNTPGLVRKIQVRAKKQITLERIEWC